METKIFLHKGKKLAYRTAGAGPLAVLLHGFGEDGTAWRHQYGLFPNHTLIIPDLPGTGDSEMLDDMSMEGMAEAVYELVLHVGGPAADGNVTMIGHSMGGYITLAFAERHPERLNAFGLFHSTAFADSEEKRETRRKGIEKMKAEGTEAFLKTFIAGLYSDATKAERPGLVDEQLSSVQNISSAALIAYFEAMMARPDRTDVLRQATVPVLFVMGRHDKAVPAEDVLKQCHLPQTAAVHLLKASAHMGMAEEREKTNSLLAAFVNYIGRPAQT